MRSRGLLVFFFLMTFSAAILSQASTEAAVLNQKGLEEYEQKRYQEAADYFVRALTLDGDFASAHFNLGTAYYYLRSFGPAIESLKQGVRREPFAAKYQNQLGVTYLQAGDIKNAVEAFLRALALDPDYPRAQYNLGCALIRQNKFTTASKLLENAKLAQPNDAEIRLNLAVALHKMQSSHNRMMPKFASTLLLRFTKWGNQHVRSKRWKPPFN